MTTTNLSIAYVTDDFLPAKTGVGVHVQKVASEMARRGHKVVVITSRRKNQPDLEDYQGIRVYRVFSIPLEGYYQALPPPALIEKIFLENSVELVHFHYLSLMMLEIADMARRRKIKTIYTTHMTIEHLTNPAFMKPFKMVLTKMLVHAYSRFDCIICLSSFQARWVGQFNVSSHVHFILNPIEYTGEECPEFDRREKFTVFFAGRLSPEKNIGYLIDSFHRFLKICPDADLWIAGSGVTESELRRQVKDLGIEGRVTFLGQVTRDQLPKYYRQCHVFVLPSLTEVLPLVALEAMRFSRPTIVTDRIFCAPEIVDHEQTGFIVDAGSADDLAGRLNQLCAAPELGRRLGAAAFKKSANYSAQGVSDSLEKVYFQERMSRIYPEGVDPVARDTAVVLDRRHICPGCGRGAFDERIDQVLIASDAQKFLDEYFVVWRCNICWSLHSMIKVPMDKYYPASPYRLRTLNFFNRPIFENALKELESLNVDRESKILFCGVSAKLYQDYLSSRGWSGVDLFDEIPSPENLEKTAVAAYDAVVAVEFLDWAEDPDTAIGLLSDKLRPGGLLILNSPDARRLNLSLDTDRLNQPYGLHIYSQVAVELLAKSHGLKKIRIDHRNWLDTWNPFINDRALYELTRFGDGSKEFAFRFRPKDFLKKWWLLPRYVMIAFVGRLFPDRVNMIAVFSK